MLILASKGQQKLILPSKEQQGRIIEE